MKNERIYKIGEFATIFNLSISTLRVWDREGKLVPKRTATGHRYYTDADIAIALSLPNKPVEKINIIYSRVSSPKQKNDLERQSQALESFCLARGLIIGKSIKESGGGLNYKRTKFLEILHEIELRRINTLVIAHKDRWCRFCFEFFEHFCSVHGCEIIVVNQESASPQQELIEDLMAVIHSFYCRLYGLRK